MSCDQLQLFMDVEDLLAYVDYTVDSFRGDNEVVPRNKLLCQKLAEAKYSGFHKRVLKEGIKHPVVIWHNDGTGSDGNYYSKAIGAVLGNGHHRVACAREARRWRSHFWVPVVHNTPKEGIFNYGFGGE